MFNTQNSTFCVQGTFVCFVQMSGEIVIMYSTTLTNPFAYPRWRGPLYLLTVLHYTVYCMTAGTKKTV